MADNQLPGLHALVTGGGTGIGLAIADALASAGAIVTICGRTLSTLEAAAGQRHFPLVMDVRDPENVRAATEEAVEKRGRIAIHVANAGIAESARFEDMDLEFWRMTMATNLDGAYLSVRESLKSMRTGNWGRIIAVASVAGLRGLKTASAYTASKHGLVGLVRALSDELIGTGITCNAICPGYVSTPILSRNVEAVSAKTGKSPDEVLASFTRLNRHKRIIDPAEVATAALWLCAPGSESINGLALPITGGQI